MKVLNLSRPEKPPENGDRIRKVFDNGGFEEYVYFKEILTIEEEALQWRNQKLAETDWIVPVTDHSEYDIYMAFRQILRDWPDTSDFPDVRPSL